MQRGNRRPLRLAGYDYRTPGEYFVTVCVHQRRRLLGCVVGDGVERSPAGAMVARAWTELGNAFDSVTLDAFIVMPDHIHGIVRLRGEKAPPLGDVVSRLKARSTHAYAHGVRELGWPPFRQRLWQRGYWERVVRSDEERDAIREYIAQNPLRWRLRIEKPTRHSQRPWD